MARLTAGRGYFLDTYAIVEFLAGNRKFLRYFESMELVTSVMNLVELYYYVLSRQGEKQAKEAWIGFRAFQRDIVADDVAQGMGLRLRMRAQHTDFSYADAIGYAMSERLGVRFLTGDTAFEGMPNVEFVR